MQEDLTHREGLSVGMATCTRKEAIVNLMQTNGTEPEAGRNIRKTLYRRWRLATSVEGVHMNESYLI